MEFTRGAAENEETFVDGLVVLALRLKWFLLPILVGIVCGLVGLVIGGLVGAILVAYMVIVVVFSGIGLSVLLAIKAYESRD